MNKQRQEAKELLELEIKLTRLKIAASYLKQQQMQAKQTSDGQPLWRFLDLGSGVSALNLIEHTAKLPVKRQYRFGALAALLAFKVWQNYAVKKK
ncbi:hypothetical protein [Neisseria perflava]|uniref:hypothetical protein n=1 Tax=Neisseria perflava TaxID=33053 RepID=UPI00209E72B1|nr:hypothetical protein [Neisseria perflava]MCP1661201.1 hypothetical protein [Neisseria perflava]MCP1771690.1 hypothetical protein [Neisseria perflava]